MDAIELGNRLRSINIEKIIDDVLMENETFILDLIRLQLSKGQSGGGMMQTYSYYRDGNEISELYIDWKLDKGLFKGDSLPHYDLRGETGDFYNSLKILFKSNYLETLSTDPKLESIEKSTEMNISGGDVLELNKESTDILIQRIKPIIQERCYGYLRN